MFSSCRLERSTGQVSFSNSKPLHVREQCFEVGVLFAPLLLLHAPPEPVLEAVESEWLDVPVDLIEEERVLRARRERRQVAHAEDAHFPLEAAARTPRVADRVGAQPEDVPNDGEGERLAVGRRVPREDGEVTSASGPRSGQRQCEWIVIECTIQ